MYRLTLCLLLVTLSTTTTLAHTWHVERDGSGDTTVIQEAVDVSAPGDTILVGEGHFDELEIRESAYWTREAVVFVTHDLTVIGDGIGRTYVGLSYDYEADHGDARGFYVTDAVLTLRNLTIKFVECGVDVTNSSLDASECAFRNSHYGIYGRYEEDIKVRSSTFTDLITGIEGQWGASLDIEGSTMSNIGFSCISGSFDFNTITDCDFNTITASGYAAGSGCIHLVNSGGTIQSCLLTCDEGTPLRFFTSAFTLIDNEIHGGSPQLHITNGGIAGTGNVFRGTTFVGWPNVTIYCNRARLELLNGSIRHGISDYTIWAEWSGLTPVTLNVQSNWWGVLNSEELDEWIYDRHDDPTNNAVVDYHPMLDRPMSDEAMSWGRVKTMFHGDAEVRP